jgi:hypothetical protein
MATTFLPGPRMDCAGIAGIGAGHSINRGMLIED